MAHLYHSHTKSAPKNTTIITHTLRSMNMYLTDIGACQIDVFSKRNVANKNVKSIYYYIWHAAQC